MKVDWSVAKVKLPPECYKLTPITTFPRGDGKSGCDLDRIISEVNENNREYISLHALAGEEFTAKIRKCIHSDNNMYDLPTETQIVRECIKLLIHGMEREQIYEIVDKARVLILNADMIHSALCVASGSIRSDTR